MLYRLGLMFALALVGCQKGQQQTKPVDEIASLQKSIAEHPSFENYINLGLALAKSNRNSEALVAYQKAADVNPQAPVAWNNMCFELANLNRLIEAKTSCQKALAIEPNFQLASNNLQMVERKIDDFRQQAIAGKASLLKNPNRTSQEVIDIGMSFYNIHDFDAAAEVWQLIQPAEELYAIAQNNIASSNILMGRLSVAEKALERAMRRDSENPLFKNNRAWLEEEKKKLNQ